MAEAIGLAFGGIALTGLVSSCVDILEYTNSARYWLCDLNLAMTKVELLQYRLDHLRKLCLAATASGHGKSGDAADDWSTNIGCGIATQGLSGVKSVLQQTDKLCRRYSLAHMEAEGEHYSATHRSQDVQSPTSTATHHLDQPQLVAVKPWRRLGRQLSWALQDKKKFDRLITDLDFLLSNTEQVFQRASSATVQACQPRKPASSSETLSGTSTPDEIYRGNTSPGTETALCSTTPPLTQLTKGSMSPRGAQVGTKATSKKQQFWATILPEPPTESDRALVLSTVARQASPAMQTDDSGQTYAENIVEGESTFYIDVKDKHGQQRGGVITKNRVTNNSSFSIGGSDPIAAKLALRRMDMEEREANRNSK